MKKYAFYLPQFHEIEENNKWWGEGFTEWTNIKKARKFYEWQTLDKPLNNNYYNLLDRETVEWQTSLMHEYKIDGFIYYHYWFEGKLLMEKPAENLLEWKDINQDFFFCWANHSFTRGGYNQKEVLLEQKYGKKDDWENHFHCLLQFFRDSRYVKENNKPLFMIFKSDFAEMKEMIRYFDQKCKEAGFNGICLIESYHGDKYPQDTNIFKDKDTYKYVREPAFEVFAYKYKIRYSFKWLRYRVLTALNKRGLWNKPVVYDGNELLRIKMDMEPSGCNIIHGLCFSWDNTSRHGEKGYIITPITKETFINYLNTIKEDKYLIINAWNEWCEGMILEPTEANKYKYLEWIKEWSDDNDL